jgi:amphiphysin
MNSMQRQFGKLTHKGAGDDAKVSVLLQDFEEADKMLTKVSARIEIPCEED